MSNFKLKLPQLSSTRELYGKTWHYRFVKTNTGGSLTDAYGEEKLKSMLIICWDRKDSNRTTKLFSAFTSHEEFIDWISQVDEKEWSFFEYILGNQRQKLYFDIDIDVDEFQTRYSELNIDNFCRGLISRLTTEIMSWYDYRNFTITPEESILLFSSSSAKKRSFHIVVDGYAAKHNLETKKVANDIYSQLDKSYQEFIDKDMWKSSQQFRIYKSQKPDSNRPKLLQKTFYGEKERTDREVFLKSFITYTKDCNPMNVLLFSQVEKFICNYDDYITDDILEEIKKQCKNNNLFKIYNVKEICGNRIDLTRVQPSNCTICEKQHDNDNAYITVSKWGVVNYYCRAAERHTDGKSYFEVADVKHLLEDEDEDEDEFYEFKDTSISVKEKPQVPDSVIPSLISQYQMLHELAGM